MDNRLSNIGFHSLKPDPCAYAIEDKTGFAILTLYMDYFILLDVDKQLLGKLKKQLTNLSEMTDLGDVLRVFDMNVTRDSKNRGHPRALRYDELQAHVYAGRRIGAVP